MTLSVCCITYNQKNFIIQAIEGFLSQKTNFDFEIIIGDDCSNDDTEKICKTYQQKYPEKIKLFLNEKNLGAVANFLQVYNACKGKYIAICEGDDYWTDPYKLQKQVDFLEANPGYSTCFHAVNILENEKLKPSELNLSDKEQTYSILDLANSNLIHTPSVVFRNGLIKEFPTWFNQSPVGDYVLHLLNAKKGLIKYFPETMAVYRIHNSGTWSQKNMSEVYSKSISLLDNLMKEDFDESVIKVLAAQKTRRIHEFITWALNKKEYEVLKTIAHQYLQDSGADITDVFVNDIVNYITELEGQIKLIKESGSYSLASKLSRLKKAVKG